MHVKFQERVAKVLLARWFSDGSMSVPLYFFGRLTQEAPGVSIPARWGFHFAKDAGWVRLNAGKIEITAVGLGQL